MNTAIAGALFSLFVQSGLAPTSSVARPDLESKSEASFPAAPIYQDEWYLTPDDSKSYLLVREYGEGAPVVVLHGGWGAEHGYLLDAIWPHRAQHRFVMYDQRGSLRSPALSSNISLQRHVEDLDDLREELGLERMTIFAHSMGTYLAMTYAQKHPERVERLVLTGAVPPVYWRTSRPMSCGGSLRTSSCNGPPFGRSSSARAYSDRT